MEHGFSLIVPQPDPCPIRLPGGPYPEFFSDFESEGTPAVGRIVRVSGGVL
jgi:hypothetical protein